ncbi:hypothetical protein L218DRAFT_942801 [Marasmius fiardii PR-910]|nr:hypothetical protein L218DRAFT_942801 [Marasmius fiardii PR-910]
MCKYLGLPFKLHITRMERWEESWPTRIYKTLYNFQIANGFNPESTDFAQTMDERILKFVPPQQSQFQEIHEESNESYSEIDTSLSTLEDDQIQAAPEESIEGFCDTQVEDYPEVIHDFISLDLLFGDVYAQETMLLASSCVQATEAGKSQQARSYTAWWFMNIAVNYYHLYHIFNAPGREPLCHPSFADPHGLEDAKKANHSDSQMLETNKHCRSADIALDDKCRSVGKCPQESRMVAGPKKAFHFREWVKRLNVVQ